MNILIVIGSLNFGGAEKQAVQDANLLSKENNVSLICYQKGPLIKLLNKDVKTIHIERKNYLIRALMLTRIIKKNRVEVVHASLFASMISSGISRLFTRFRLFWHFHSHEYQMSYIAKLLIKTLSRFSSIEKMLFVNEELLSFYRSRFNLSSVSLGILYNSTAITNSYVKTPKEDLVTVGYTGRLVELKRVEYLVELAEFFLKNSFRSFQILIVGDGEKREQLVTNITKKNIANHFIFTGFKINTSEWYAQMDLFALPSREECLSMVTIDASAHGIPTVAFDIGGNSEIIENGITGFIVNTKEDFFHRIYQLAIDEELRNNLGENARNHCYQKFGDEKHLKDLYQLYHID